MRVKDYLSPFDYESHSLNSFCAINWHIKTWYGLYVLVAQGEINRINALEIMLFEN